MVKAILTPALLCGPLHLIGVLNKLGRFDELVPIAPEYRKELADMAFITVTRPDGSRIALNTADILSVVEAPPQSSPLAGPPGARTRINFSNQSHQDVTETADQVLDLIKEA